MKIFKFIIIITGPFIDLILAGSGLDFPMNLLRITPLILAIAALYNIRKFFVPIMLAALFFILFSYPYDIQALFLVLMVPGFFIVRRLFFFLSEQWLVFTVLFLGFSSGYMVWLISNILWGSSDYGYFFYVFVCQVIINVLAALLVLKLIERFTDTRLYEISTRI